jgi:hypothetical protein
MADNPYPASSAFTVQPQGAPPGRIGSGVATTSLVLGILALISCWTVVGGILLGLAAIVLGFVGLRRANRGQAGGHGRALVGLITGVLGALIAIVLIVVGASLLNSPKGKALQNCLRDAGNNQAAVQQCKNQYQNGN